MLPCAAQETGEPDRYAFSDKEYIVVALSLQTSKAIGPFYSVNKCFSDFCLH